MIEFFKKITMDIKLFGSKCFVIREDESRQFDGKNEMRNESLNQKTLNWKFERHKTFSHPTRWNSKFIIKIYLIKVL